MTASGIWEPYFRPTTRVHDSGFRCFECGYLQVDTETNKTAKKVIIARGVDYITNRLFDFHDEPPARVYMDLLKDGNIRLFCHRQQLLWNIPGFSDAGITTLKNRDFHNYDRLDEIWEKECKNE